MLTALEILILSNLKGITLHPWRSSRSLVRADRGVRIAGRVGLGGCPPRPPTDPGLHITRTRFLIS